MNRQVPKQDLEEIHIISSGTDLVIGRDSEGTLGLFTRSNGKMLYEIGEAEKFLLRGFVEHYCQCEGCGEFPEDCNCDPEEDEEEGCSECGGLECDGECEEEETEEHCRLCGFDLSSDGSCAQCIENLEDTGLSREEAEDAYFARKEAAEDADATGGGVE